MIRLLLFVTKEPNIQWVILDYDDTKIVNNSGEDGSIENISVGEIITQNEHTDTYGNNQVVRTVTTNYKVAENDTTSKATKIEVFYNTNQIATYVTQSYGTILIQIEVRHLPGVTIS